MARRATGDSEDGVPLADPDTRKITDAPLTLDPALRREHHHRVLGDDEGLRIELRLVEIATNPGRARNGVAPFELVKLGLDEIPTRRFTLQELPDALRFLLLLFELLLDEKDLKTRETVKAKFEDRVNLHLIELEALHQLLRRVSAIVRAADDADGLIERVVDGRETFEDMDALFELREIELEALGDDLHAEVEEVADHAAEVEPLGGGDVGLLGGDEAGEVDLDVGL